MKYRVFTRTWWRANKDWPNGREPGAGRRSYAGHPQYCTLEEARAYCKQWNATHDPGPLSRKAEFEERWTMTNHAKDNARDAILENVPARTHRDALQKFAACFWFGE